ncbi:MAG: MFS transporter [Chloroflexota bacterium]|nr:MAG: MFS transporter [Chloroflexota bacterium]
MLRLWAALRANQTLMWACFVIAVNQLGFGIVVPVTPIYARGFGVSEVAVGLVVAVYGLGRFLFNVPAGQAADRFGRRPVIFVGTVVTAVGSILCGLAPDFNQLLAYRFIGGIGAAIVITGVQTVVADIATRENRGRMMATYQGFFIFAVGVGPGVGGTIAVLAGPRAPFFVFAALAALAGALALWRLPETRGVALAAANAAGSAVPRGVTARLLLTNVGFMTLSIVTFVQFFNRTGAIFSVVPIDAVERLGLDTATIGLALTVSSLCNIALVGWTGSIADRLGRKITIVPGCVIGGVSLFGFAFAPGYAMFLGSAVLWGICGALIASSAAYAADLAPPGATGLTMGVYRMLADLGYVVGPVLLGLIAEVAGANGSLLVAGALSILTAIPFALLAPETGGRRAAVPPARV